MSVLLLAHCAACISEVMRETRCAVSATRVRCMPAAAVGTLHYTFFCCVVTSAWSICRCVELLFLLAFSSSTVQVCGDNPSLSSAHSSCCHRCPRTGVCSLCMLCIQCCTVRRHHPTRCTCVQVNWRLVCALILRHSFAMRGVALECTSSYWSVLSLLVGVG